MAEQKGKILKVDTKEKFVLFKTNISDKTNAGVEAGWRENDEVETFVKIDFSTVSDEWIMENAAKSLRIDVRRAHLIPMGPDECRKTMEANPFVVSAENASTSGRPRAMKLEDKSVEQLEALKKKVEELLRAKK